MQSVFHTVQLVKNKLLKSHCLILIQDKIYNTSRDLYNKFQFCASFHIYLERQMKSVIYKYHRLKTAFSLWIKN